MSSRRTGAWFVLAFTILTAGPAAAAGKPINISLFPPIAIAQPTEAVTAFRWDILYGKNTSVQYVDLGLVNQTTTMASGLQLGFVNYNEGKQSGIQLGTINYDKGATSGFQWAAVNYAGEAGGLQLALLNYAERIKGVQIGVVNIIKTGGMFPVMVIANWGKQ
jgi:hypothetical protein